MTPHEQEALLTSAAEILNTVTGGEQPWAILVMTKDGGIDAVTNLDTEGLKRFGEHWLQQTKISPSETRPLVVAES